MCVIYVCNLCVIFYFSSLLLFIIIIVNIIIIIIIHIPQHIQLMIKSLYTNFKTSIITSDFNTPFVEVGRGVLQGDCLSPLLFNLCFNTFIQHIKSEKYQQFVFSSKLLNPIHWFQFADDAAVINHRTIYNGVTV